MESLEQFLHKTFVGQKRFSIEGLDALVPMLDDIIAKSVSAGTTNVNIGMAHRGRLNVLAHVLGKPYEIIFLNSSMRRTKISFRRKVRPGSITAGRAT